MAAIRACVRPSALPSGNRHLRDLHVLDSETMTWHAPEVKGAVPPGLRGHTANLIGSRIFLFGGCARGGAAFRLSPGSTAFASRRPFLQLRRAGEIQ